MRNRQIGPSRSNLFEVPEQLVREKGGGGGSSGKVDYPQYIKDWHEWLAHHEETAYGTHGSTGAVVAAVADNPYDVANNAGAVAYDPDTEVAAILAAASGYSGNLNAQSTLLGTLIPVAETEWNDHIAPTETDDDLVDTYEDDQFDTYAQGVNRLNALAAGNNAVLSSAFVLARSNLENQYARDVARYREEIAYQRWLEIDKLKISAVLQMTDFMGRMLALELDAEREEARMDIEANRLKIVAKSEEAVQNLEIDIDEVMWDLKVYQAGANVLASHSGGTVTDGRQPSKIGTAIGGALMAASLMGGGGGGMMGASLGGGGGMTNMLPNFTQSQAVPGGIPLLGGGSPGGHSSVGQIGGAAMSAMLGGGPTLGPLSIFGSALGSVFGLN